MLAIYKKEIASYFRSMIGWLFLAVNLFFAGWNFRYYGMMAGYPYISYVLSAILMIFLLSVPILTMKVFSEEARTRTDQLLYTSPVSVWKIILGKYLALVTIFSIMLLILCLYPLVLKIYGSVPLGENYVAIFSFWVFGITCIAIGVFLSVLTESQIIAAVLTFFTLLLGAMMQGICNLISANGNVITDILQVFNITSYFMNYGLNGMIYLPSLLYYASVIFLCLFLTGFVILKRRWRVATHGIGKAVGSISGVVVMILVIIAVNVGIGMLPGEYTTLDITYNRLYSLLPETKAYLETVNQPVTMYYLADQSAMDETLHFTLTAMDENSDQITVIDVSPTENPYFYASYTDTMPMDNSVIVVCGDKHKVVEYNECYQSEILTQVNYLTGEYEVVGYEVTGYDGEGSLVAAIDYVTGETDAKIYCIAGHDELELDTTLASLIANANYEMETINLLTYDAIPEDASCLFLIAPLQDYNDDELAKIEAYLQKGGNAMIVVAFSDSGELTNYYRLLQPYGLKVCPGLVMEEGSSYYNGQQYLLLPDIKDTEFTEGIYSVYRTKYIYMPYAKGMKEEETLSDVSLLVFLTTTEYAYSTSSYNMDVDETAPEMGPFILGAYASKVYPDGISEIVAFSSEYLLWSDMNEAVGGNNYSVFMNAVNKLMGEEEAGIIPPKPFTYDPILMNSTARSIFSVLLIGIIPGGLVLTGFNIWFLRRKY
ncbi:MAG: Gldg family protein [Lachnospiraceae bacterium]|nr:Gldg family protein [Lachnospiraceae bacterium]